MARPPRSPRSSRSSRSPELLVLARHARPVVSPDVPRTDWELSDEGIEAAARLGDRLRPIGADLVVSSVERKAMQTGWMVADALGVTFQTGHDLHEHVRSEVPLVSDEVFDASMRAFFDRPSERVFGDETAAQAEARFTSAVDALVKAHRGRRLVVVSHGTVLALHLAARYGLNAWATWKRLGQPSYVVVEQRSKTVVDIAASV